MSRYGNSLKKGYLNGVYISTKTGNKEMFESSYELRRFKALDASPLVKFWTRSKDKIPYSHGGRKRRYHPDIFVEYNDGQIFLEEVKGYVWNKLKFFRKNFRANWVCKNRGWKFRVLFEKDIDTVL